MGTFFLFHRANKSIPPKNLRQSQNEDLDLPSQLDCVVDATFNSVYGSDDLERLSVLDVCSYHDNDALSEVLVAIKGPRHRRPKLVVALIDTGADVSIIHPAVVAHMPIETIANIRPSSKAIRAVNGGLVRSLG